MTRIALSACILALSLAAATAQEQTKSGAPTAAEENANLPSIAEEAAISGAGPSGPDSEEKTMDEMESAADQDGCSATNDDPAVCDGELLD